MILKKQISKKGRLKISKHFQTAFFYADFLSSICRMLLFSAFCLFFS